MLQNGFLGTWKLNLAKSDIPPVTKSQILTIYTDGVNVAMREELVNDKDEHLVYIFKNGWFPGATEVYRFSGGFLVVRNEEVAGRPISRPISCS